MLFLWWLLQISYFRKSIFLFQHITTMHIKTLPAFFIIIVLIFSISACNSNVHKTSLNPEKDTIVNTDAFPADSFAFYEKILIKDSLNTQLHMDIAINYYAEKQFDKAIEHFMAVCRMDNKNAEALITLGNVYFDTEQNEKAIIYYEKALALDPKNVNVRCDLATSYLNIKNTEKSYSLLKENIKMAPKHAQSHHNLSVVYTQMGKAKEADAEMKTFNELSK